MPFPHSSAELPDNLLATDDIDYPTRGTYQTVGCPVKLSDSPAQLSRPPLLGEHADALLSELCGVDPDEVKRLREDGVV